MTGLQNSVSSHDDQAKRKTLDKDTGLLEKSQMVESLMTWHLNAN